ncbi:unnamed protein product [Lymnaea stagnalis]|uniref:Germinal-center associated nuclear protein n=1 Tax=Lymnaea stagnalis TaxID=6523 RepID=A0AAV2H0C9_LYMST
MQTISSTAEVQGAGTSLFGGQGTQTSRIVFDGQGTKTGSVFSGLGTQTSTSIFGGQGTQGNTSIFGGQGTQTVSIFGGQGIQTGPSFTGQRTTTGSTFGGKTFHTGPSFGAQGMQSGSSGFGGQGTLSGFGSQEMPPESSLGGQAILGTAQTASIFGGQAEQVSFTSKPGNDRAINSGTCFGSATTTASFFNPPNPSVFSETSSSKTLFGGKLKTNTNKLNDQSGIGVEEREGTTQSKSGLLWASGNEASKLSSSQSISSSQLRSPIFRMSNSGGHGSQNTQENTNSSDQQKTLLSSSRKRTSSVSSANSTYSEKSAMNTSSGAFPGSNAMSLFSVPVKQTSAPEATGQSASQLSPNTGSWQNQHFSASFGQPKQFDNLQSSKSLFGKTQENTAKETVQFSRQTQGSMFPVTQSSNEIVELGKHSSTSSANLQGPKLFGHVPQAPALSEIDSSLFGKSQTSSRLSRTASSFNLMQHAEREANDTHEEFQERTSGNQDQNIKSPPRQSLTKWNKARDNAPQEDHRKRSQPSSTQETELRQSKRSRFPGGQESASSPPARPRLLSARRSTEDLSSKTIIVVKEIPAHLNKQTTLRNHFSQFGNILRLHILANKRSANITFETHEQAQNAKNEGKHLSKNGPPLSIFWRAASVKSPESRKSSESLSRKRNLFSSIVDDELASMAGTSDYQEEMAGTSAQDKPRISRPGKETQKPPTSRRHSPTPPPTSSATSVSHSAAPDLEVAKEMLKKIFRAKAKDTTEKIAILDAKDKFLKILRGRQQSDLASAKAFLGTCPDMCPEKERYYREDIRRLALYEVIPSTLTSVTGQKSKVDHSRAVKEYSRSSADQEEPLPHELRPLPVLVKTMHYLLTEIADQGGDGQWAEWYDFLWNRTRGIRKDITQQQLCDIQVAELLEKCTRFHIFCSERLCEEDMMTFDAKINNENLTKCLQTLKELYADLEKRQVYCPNEAEFRGYMVLMNLNEGDILREIQQLRPEIRDSPQISFAVKAYNALNSNNYVRFFRLFQEASFLNGCVLHRYFNQIRSKALLIIMKALGALGKNRVMYPIEEMIRLLCFEDSKEVVDFCDHYCLATEGSDVVMDSKAYLEPESAIPQKRSQSLIEVKQTVSVGETLNGGPLPQLDISTPAGSFDPDGGFVMSHDIQEALASSGLLGSKTIVSSTSEPISEQANSREESAHSQTHSPDERSASLRLVPEMRREKLTASNEVIKSIARMLILEVIDSSSTDIAQEVLAVQREYNITLMAHVDDIVSYTVTECLGQLAREVYEQEECILRKALEVEMAQQRQRVFDMLCQDITDDTMSEMVKILAQDEMRLVQAELKAQSLERASQTCRDELVSKGLEDMLLDIAHEVYQVDVVAKQERLEATERCVQLGVCRKFFQSWRKSYQRRMKVKRSMLDFPSAPPSRTVAEQLRQLVPGRSDQRISQKAFYIGHRVKLSIESPMEVIRQQLQLSTRLSMASAIKMLCNLLLWRPLDLEATVGPQLQRAYQNWKEESLIEQDTVAAQWKLLVSLPCDASDDVETFLQWIKAKLCKDGNRAKVVKSPSYEGQVLSVCQMKPSVGSGSHSALCVRCFQGVWTEDQELNVLKEDVLKGSSALLFLSSPVEMLLTNNTSLSEITWNNDRKRLNQILKQKRKEPALPLVIMMPRLTKENQISLKILDECLGLASLYQQNLVSAVHVAQPVVSDQEILDNYEDWTSQLTNSLRFAVGNIPVPPKLRVKPVSDYVEDAVVEFYKATVYQDLRTRKKHQMLHQSPNTLISLYNEVIEHVAMVSASSSLTDMSWPAPEFEGYREKVELQASWNTESHLSDLYELIAKMRLPRFHYSDLDSDSWSTMCQDVWSYIERLTKKDSGSAKIHLHQEVAMLLSKAKKNFDQFCWLSLVDGPCEPTYVNMTWTDLVDACIHYKLFSLRTGHICLPKPESEDNEEPEEEEFEEILVYYQEFELEDWEPPGAWLDAMKDTETAEKGQIKPTVLKAASKLKTSCKSYLGDVNLTTNKATGGTVAALTDVNLTTNKAPGVQDASFQASTSSWETLKEHYRKEREASYKYEQSLTSFLEDPSLSGAQHEAGPGLFPFTSNITPITSNITPLTRARSQEVDENLPRSRQSGRSGEAQDSILLGTPRITARHVATANNMSAKMKGSQPKQDLRTTVTEKLSTPSLSDKLKDLENMMIAEREADKLFEMKLKALHDGPFI